MLSKFIYNDCFKKIPYTGGVYEIDCHGTVRDSFSKTVLDPYHEKGTVRITTNSGEWFDSFELNVLMAIVHRNCILPLRLLDKLEVIHKSGKPDKVSLYDTVWKCPEGKLNHPLYPGFCYIPGYSRYLINQKGELLSPIKGELLSPYEDGNGYLMYGVQPDVGPRTIVGMHRLLALAWKEYPADVDKLDVNHLDAVKSNNELENLEWASRSRNNFHAHELGLSNSSPITVRDVVTGEITGYYSFEDAARHLDADGETIRQRIKNGKDGRVYNGLQYKLKSDKSPWVIFDNVDDYTRADPSKKVEIIEISTGSKVTAKSIAAASNIVDINRSTLTYRFSKSNQITVNGYLLTLVT